ncbi:nucleotide-binding protein [Sinosporangium siamense]|uniref:nucleotide-binding protein n=1 Tax=Sinosporangium siamense TaxID=1367973 RepID=UPI00403AEF6E
MPVPAKAPPATAPRQPTAPQTSTPLSSGPQAPASPPVGPPSTPVASERAESGLSDPDLRFPKDPAGRSTSPNLDPLLAPKPSEKPPTATTPPSRDPFRDPPRSAARPTGDTDRRDSRDPFGADDPRAGEPRIGGPRADEPRVQTGHTGTAPRQAADTASAVPSAGPSAPEAEPRRPRSNGVPGTEPGRGRRGTGLPDAEPLPGEPGRGRRGTGTPDGEPASSAEPYRPRRRQASAPPSALTPKIRSDSSRRPSADSLDPESLLRGRRTAPTSGWRRMVYKASAGWIKPGESPEVRRRRELVARARTAVAAGHHRVAVLSLKGGVGKTTTTVGLGATLAQVRGDRVIAVDANPDRGTLSDKVELETAATVRDLLNERGQIKRYVDVRAFTSQTPSRLEILASDRDPSVSEAFSATDYQAVAQVLENFYSICITDCGTGLLHSAMSGVLGLADQLVLVSSPSVDGARAASATLDWLEAHHYGDLVKAASVVLCNVRPRSKSTVDLDRLEAHFAARCRAVVRVPYDAHLEEGAEIDLERLQPATRDSYLRLAASVGDGFAGQALDRA